MKGTNVPQALTDIVNEVTSLPALPQVVNHIINTVSDPESQVGAASELIAREPAIAARLLRLVNSAHFALPQKINDIHRAIVVMGMNTLRSVLLSSSMIGTFRAGQPTGFNRAKFWKHAIACASIARELADRKDTDVELAFSAGLLHDTGKLIIDYYLPADMEHILRKAERDKLAFHAVEIDVADVDHAQIGAELAAAWELDESLQAAIRSHHDASLARDETLYSCISFANYLCHMKGLLAGNFCPPKIDKFAWKILALTQSDLPALLNVVNREVSLADAILCTSF